VSAAGGCLCGAVTFTTDRAPVIVRQCWCRDCQRIASGGATTNAFYPADAVRIAGTLAFHSKPADSGPLLERGFCPTCGTHVTTQSEARRHIIGLRVGTFDAPADFAPSQVIWTASAPSWARIDPALPAVERQPPPLS
jgi:hypothetical protein